MISFKIAAELSRSGDPVLRIDGRLLASSIDPVREATTWSKNASAKVKSGATVCIVGAGCGYHLREFKKSNPSVRFVVIERSREVADWGLAQFSDLAAETFLVGENPGESALGTLEEWSERLFAVGAVLVHGPTAQLHPEWTQTVSRFVLARDRTMFLNQMRARPELLAIVDPAKIETMQDRLVSIKTVSELFKLDPSDSQERRVWRVLEELIT
ncbi:MAG: hypothetical protein V4692_09355 [Bdellovibrionota bacterium]